VSLSRVRGDGVNIGRPSRSRFRRIRREGGNVPGPNGRQHRYAMVNLESIALEVIKAR
jgi:hypothetical protein